MHEVSKSDQILYIPHMVLLFSFLFQSQWENSCYIIYFISLDIILYIVF